MNSGGDADLAKAGQPFSCNVTQSLGAIAAFNGPTAQVIVAPERDDEPSFRQKSNTRLLYFIGTTQLSATSLLPRPDNGQGKFILSSCPASAVQWFC